MYAWLRKFGYGIFDWIDKNYIDYLENKFTTGMSWDNLGEWEIDHILPVSKGGSFHYTNTQPLWMRENRQKSNKLI